MFQLVSNFFFLKKVDELGVGNLKTAPINLKKASDAVRKEVVKKTLYDKLLTIINNFKKMMHLFYKTRKSLQQS